MNVQNPYRNAMDLIKDGDWAGAHAIVEAIETPMAAHIHAYLHRIEGDEWNANYWYGLAGVKKTTCSIEEEWAIIDALI